MLTEEPHKAMPIHLIDKNSYLLLSALHFDGTTNNLPLSLIQSADIIICYVQYCKLCHFCQIDAIAIVLCAMNRGMNIDYQLIMRNLNRACK